MKKETLAASVLASFSLLPALPTHAEQPKEPAFYSEKPFYVAANYHIDSYQNCYTECHQQCYGDCHCPEAPDGSCRKKPIENYTDPRISKRTPFLNESSYADWCGGATAGRDHWGQCPHYPARKENFLESSPDPNYIRGWPCTARSKTLMERMTPGR